MSYSVAQNTTFLTVASILQKIISFVYFIFVARTIGVANTGQYFFALTFTTIFTVVADFGLGAVLTREAAKYPENIGKYFSTVFWAKIFFGLVAYGLIFALVNILNYPLLTRELIYLSGVTVFFDSLQSAFYSIFRARKNLLFEAVGIISSQFLTLLIGTFALINHWPLIWLIAAYTIPSFLNTIYAYFSANHVYGLSQHWSLPDKQIAKLFLALAWPFALAGIIGRLYSYSDSLLMSKMLTNRELGWWSVPYKITFAFQFIPLALSASVYPAMSSLYISDHKKIGELFEKSWRYLFTIIFPLALGLIVLARPVVTHFYGIEYAPSAVVLQILLVSLIFGFLSFVNGATLNATGRQITQTGLIFFVLVINVVLNLIVLPIWGITGAAISATVSNAVLCLAGFYLVTRQVEINLVRLFIYLNQTFWPAVIMSPVVYYLSHKINFIFTIPLGAIIYAGLLFLTGGLSMTMVRKGVEKIF